MSLNVFNAQDEITALLKTIPSGAETIAVYEGALTDEAMAEYVAEQGIKPFIVVNYSSLAQPPVRHKGACGAAHDIAEMQIIVQCIADTSRNARRVWAEINKRLKGFKPQSSGELSPALFMSTGGVNFLGSPTRYSLVQTYSCFIDAD